ncbi:MAG: hypothetical protein NW215_00840 [Hyphomicrobiales bacterium]|nr:hypothetical protein [Hyphomicrobiales bacterium]
MSMAHVGHDTVIEDFVTLCPMVCISGYVVVREGAFLGAGAVVVPGKPGRPIVIGRGAYVFAGAVITKSVADGAKVAGNPAAPLRELIKRERGRR